MKTLFLTLLVIISFSGLYIYSSNIQHSKECTIEIEYINGKKETITVNNCQLLLSEIALNGSTKEFKLVEVKHK